MVDIETSIILSSHGWYPYCCRRGYGTRPRILRTYWRIGNGSGVGRKLSPPLPTGWIESCPLIACLVIEMMYQP